jgi:hypothetical protein
VKFLGEQLLPIWTLPGGRRVIEDEALEKIEKFALHLLLVEITFLKIKSNW